MIAHLHLLTNVTTKYQLPTPYGFRDIARTRFYRSKAGFIEFFEVCDDVLVNPVFSPHSLICRTKAMTKTCVFKAVMWILSFRFSLQPSATDCASILAKYRNTVEPLLSNPPLSEFLIIQPQTDSPNSI